MGEAKRRSKLRPTREMLKNFSRAEVEELTELFGALVGRFLQRSSQLVEDIEGSQLGGELDLHYPSWVALKEDLDEVQRILEEEK